jgi:hypothetical protein
MKQLLLGCFFVSMILGSFVGRAHAQTETSPPPAASSSSHTTSNVHGGGPIGLGAIAYLSGPQGLSLAFDPGIFHIDSIVGMFGGGGNPNIPFGPSGDGFHLRLGVRAWYHLFSSGGGDFSVGGGAAYVHDNPPGPNNASNALWVEGGALIRMFIVQNVGLSVGAGITLGVADAGGAYNIGAVGAVGNAAVHYFF